MALREILADLQIRVRGGQQLRQANQGIGTAVDGLRRVGRLLGVAAAAITSALALRRVVSFTNEIIRAGDEIDKTSQSLGISAQALQRWQFIAERSGVSASQLSTAFLTLQRTAGDAAQGGSETSRAYQQLGVDLRDANGNLREGEDLFQATIRALGEVTNSTQRSFLATRVFGRAGAQLLPIVNSGAEGIAELTARFEELGGAMSDEAVAAAAEAQDSLADFELAMTSLKGELAGAFLPALTRGILALATFAARVSDVLERSSALKVALGLLNVTLVLVALALAPVLLSLLGLAAPILLVILLIEDLVTLFRGGRSVIGDFIDELFGVGAAQATVEAITEAWRTLVSVIRQGAALLGIDVGPPSGELSAEEQERVADVRKEELSPDNERARRRREQATQRKDELSPTADRARSRRERRAGRQSFGVLQRRIPRGVVREAVRERRSVGASTVARGGDTTIEQTVTAPVSITVEGAGDPEAVGAVVQRRTDAALARIFANAAATLPQGA